MTDDDPLDHGMQAAFGVPTNSPRSVLARLEQKVRSKLGLHLKETEEPTAPIKVTAESRELKDPTGRYQLLGEIARGGVGTVYRGLDRDLGRDVAMKVLRDEYVDRPDVLARFVEEAQIGGQLQHPGIVPVYEMGLQAGERPYFAMKLVKGETLTAQLTRRKDVTQDRHRLLGIFEQVCQTVAYAHARNVVHRDLKPANIMIGAFGEVQVVDWGFAKVLQHGGIADEQSAMARHSEHSVIETVRSGEAGSTSLAGSMLGTPSYMPPEQAQGDIERVNQRSDVFGLGAIFCEILTGFPPYVEGDLVRQAATAQLGPALARLDACQADPVLVSLCKECLAPAQRSRPESAAVLAARIHQYLVSVEERAQEAELRATRAQYRHRVTVVAAVASVLLLGIAGTAWQWSREAARRRQVRATESLTAALGETRQAYGEAVARNLDLGAWQAAVRSAAQLRIVAESPDAGHAEREQAKALLDRVERGAEGARGLVTKQEAAQALRRKLHEIRIPTDDDVRQPGWYTGEYKRLDEAYRKALAPLLGEAPTEGRFEEQLAALQGTGIPAALVGSLDHWILARRVVDREPDARPMPELNQRLQELATALDDREPWRMQLRELIANETGKEGYAAALLALARDARIEDLDASSCRVLAMALLGVGATGTAYRVLGRATERHPDDFDLRFWQAFSMETQKRPDWQAVARGYDTAHALRPAHGEALHRRALALEEQGRFLAAERAYRRLLAGDPDNTHWLTHVAGTIRDQGRPKEAIPLFEALVARTEGGERAHKLSNLGVCYFRLKDFEAAARRFRAAIELAPSFADAYTNLGNALQHLRDVEGSLAAHDRALSIAPDCPLYIANKAAALLRKGDREGAMEHWDRALAAGGGASIAIRKAGALPASDSRGRALALMQAALREPKPANFGLWGQALFDEERFAAARLVLRHALALGPKKGDLVAIRNNLGLALTKLGETRQAIEQFQEARRLEPENPNVLSNLGDCLRVVGETEQAEPVLRKAVELDGEDPRYLANLAALLNETNRSEEALTYSQKAADQDDVPVEALLCHGEVLAELGRGEDALAVLERALGVNPRHRPTLFRKASVLLRMNRLGAAEAAYETARRMGDPDGSASNGLGRVCMTRGDLESARRHFETALRAGRRNWAIHANLGRLHTRQGRPEKAESCLLEAISLGPTRPTPYFLLVEMFASRGDREAARKMSKEAQRRFPRSGSMFATLAGLHVDFDDDDAVEALLDKARRLGAAKVDIHFAHGMRHVRAGDLGAARRALEAAAKADPSDPRVPAHLAWVLVKLNELEPARELLVRALHTRPHDAELLKRMCLVLQKLGRNREAVPYGARAVRVAPDDAFAHWNYFSVLAHSFHHELALKHARRTVELRPELRSRLQASISRLESLLADRDSLREVLELRRAPSNAAEFARTVALFFNSAPKKLLALTEACLRDHPERVVDGLYDATCSVLLWADNGDLQPKRRVQLRATVRGWLRAELDRARKALGSSAAERRKVAERIAHWHKDIDLKSVRGDALVGFPDAERYAWQEFWKDCGAFEEQLRGAR